MFLITLGLIWALIHLLCWRFPLRSGSTSVTLTSPISLHLSTTACNSLPARLLNLASKRETYWRDQGRRWRVFWDVGALVGVVGVLVAQGVLIWAAARAARVAWEVWTASDEGSGATVGLIKRGLTDAGTGGSGIASERLVLQAVVSSPPQLGQRHPPPHPLTLAFLVRSPRSPA